MNINPATILTFLAIGMVVVVIGRVFFSMIRYIVIGFVAVWILFALNGHPNPCQVLNGEFTCNMNFLDKTPTEKN